MRRKIKSFFYPSEVKFAGLLLLLCLEFALIPASPSGEINWMSQLVFGLIFLPGVFAYDFISPWIGAAANEPLSLPYWICLLLSAYGCVCLYVYLLRKILLKFPLPRNKIKTKGLHLAYLLSAFLVFYIGISSIHSSVFSLRLGTKVSEAIDAKNTTIFPLEAPEKILTPGRSLPVLLVVHEEDPKMLAEMQELGLADGRARLHSKYCNADSSKFIVILLGKNSIRKIVVSPSALPLEEILPASNNSFKILASPGKDAINLHLLGQDIAIPAEKTITVSTKSLGLFSVKKEALSFSYFPNADLSCKN